MSRFKVGKAKTRDDNEAVIYSIREEGMYPIHGAIRQDSHWESEKWQLDGKYLPTGTNRLDLFPNAAPEVYEFTCQWEVGGGALYPVGVVGASLMTLISLKGKRTKVRVEVIE